MLILGNMPSVMSLAAQQYYANPRNGFWRITGEIFGFDASAAYEVRVARAVRVAASRCGTCCGSADEHGSLDSAIEPDSMVANDFESFFDAHPAIERVFFNGAAAEKNFGRLAGIDRPLRYRRLPSTSPAQTMRYADKLARLAGGDGLSHRRAALRPRARLLDLRTERQQGRLVEWPAHHLD